MRELLERVLARRKLRQINGNLRLIPCLPRFISWSDMLDNEYCNDQYVVDALRYNKKNVLVTCNAGSVRLFRRQGSYIILFRPS